MNNYEDQTRTCVDCEREFIWTDGEQEFFHEKGFSEPPKRCKACRQAKKTSRGDGGGNRSGNHS
jgi:hypothetical protein